MIRSWMRLRLDVNVVRLRKSNLYTKGLKLLLRNQLSLVMFIICSNLATDERIFIHCFEGEQSWRGIMLIASVELQNRIYGDRQMLIICPFECRTKFVISKRKIRRPAR